MYLDSSFHRLWEQIASTKENFGFEFGFFFHFEIQSNSWMYFIIIDILDNPDLCGWHGMPMFRHAESVFLFNSILIFLEKRSFSFSPISSPIYLASVFLRSFNVFRYFSRPFIVPTIKPKYNFRLKIHLTLIRLPLPFQSSRSTLIAHVIVWLIAYTWCKFDFITDFQMHQMAQHTIRTYIYFTQWNILICISEI